MALVLVGPKGRKPKIELKWVVVAGSWHRIVLTWAWTENPRVGGSNPPPERMKMM